MAVQFLVYSLPKLANHLTLGEVPAMWPKVQEAKFINSSSNVEYGIKIDFAYVSTGVMCVRVTIF